MGYFPNGSSGMEYEERYCSKCSNYDHDEPEGCVILDLHALWNYDAANPKTETQKTMKAALDNFIPLDRNGFNMQCRMFRPQEEKSS